MKISIAFLAGTWLSTTIWTAFSADTNIVHLIKSIPNSAICPEIVCPADSFVRRDDAGNCGCSATSDCSFIKCATGPPIRNPVTGHCLCPHPVVIPPQPTCVGIACPLGGRGLYNSTLNSCACPVPPCLAKCYHGYRTGFDSTTGACTCIKEPLCPPEAVLCKAGLSYGFNEVTLTCGCFPRIPEIPPNSAPHQASFKACDIFCIEGTRLDTVTCTCIPIKACDIFCMEGFTLDTATCTCIPTKACDILCKAGSTLDTTTCTCILNKACGIFCIEGFTLDTATCKCIPTKACDIFCKEGTRLDTATCTCIPIIACDIFCMEGFTLDTATCTCIPTKACDILCMTGSTLDTTTCTCIPNNPTPPGNNSDPSSLPTPAGSCATFAPCSDGQVAGFAPFTLECGCTNCDALHCPDYQQSKFDPTSQKCYCEGVPGKCFDLVCPPPGQQLVFQQVQNPDGTVSEGCACKPNL